MVRVFLSLIILLCMTGNATGQGLQTPLHTLSLKKDTVLLSRNEYLKPTLSSARYDYYQHLGAACKLEFKFERSTSIPLRLRLGSLQQTDYMEQKPNAVKPER